MRSRQCFVTCFSIGVLVSLFLFVTPQYVFATNLSVSLSASLSMSTSNTFQSPKFFIGTPPPPPQTFFTGDGQASDFGNSILQTPVLITYDDQLNPIWTDGLVHTLQITVSSAKTGSSVPMTLVEIDPFCFDINCPPTPNTGFFRNNNLVFMNGNNQFPVGRIMTVTITDPAANINPTQIDTLSVSAYTNSSYAISDNGITRLFQETGINTGVFTGKISTTSGPSSGNAVHAVPGDVLTIRDNPSSVVSNSMITPNPRHDVAGLFVVAGDTVTATFGSFTTTAGIDPQSNEPGGGGGGLVVSPGLVLDALAASIIGGNSPNSPPSPSFDPSSLDKLSLSDDVRKSIINQDPNTPVQGFPESLADFPFSVDQNGFPIHLYTNTIQTSVEKTGQQTTLKFSLNSYSDVTHFAVYTNLRGIAREIQDSDTFIIYENGQPLQIHDPHGFFSKVDVKKINSGTKYQFIYDVKFAKPMDTSDIISRSWTEQHATCDMKIRDAWKVISSDVNTQSNANLDTPMASQHVESSIPNPPPQPSIDGDILNSIKEWGGYSPKSITDTELLNDLGLKGNHIPSWVMKTTHWVVQDEISKEDFSNALKYLSDKRIIK